MQVHVNKLQGCSRYDIVKHFLSGNNCVGIELGVAAGDFSSSMVDSGLFKEVWGVDMYADTHDTEQYKQALKKVGIKNNYKLLRMTFDDALDLFPDEYFDFVYLDGYAGNGLEGGKTLRAWASKVKIGGVIAGDDYHTDCPLLMAIVDEFVSQNSFELNLTDGAFDFSPYGHYPSWAVIKTHHAVGKTSEELEQKGVQIAKSSKAKKQRAKKVDDLIRKILPSGVYENLKVWNKNRKKRRRMKKSNI